MLRLRHMGRLPRMPGGLVSARLRLRRADGQVYLDRWGIENKRIGGVFLHRMTAPDPGRDHHDHPWWFGSWVLKGGYNQEKADSRRPSDEWYVSIRHRWSWGTIRLDQRHRIYHLHSVPTWTLVIHGPTRRGWGFFLNNGWMPWRIYDRDVRAERRDLWADIGSSK